MRSIWNGSISFGLITIPIKMYSATEEQKLPLDMLDKNDHSRIRYKRVNQSTGEEVEWKDIVKGYRVDESYVVLTDEDFEKASVEKDKTISIEEFIDKDEVSEMLYKKPYYLEPQKESGKSYNLLRDALKKTGKFGVATMVMRQKENLCLIGEYDNAIVLHMIRFADELRDPSDLKLPETKVKKNEVDMALTLIDQYTGSFDHEKYKDAYNDQLMKVIEAKSKGERVEVGPAEEKPAAAKDLMTQLKESLKKKEKEKAEKEKEHEPA